MRAAVTAAARPPREERALRFAFDELLADPMWRSPRLGFVFAADGVRWQAPAIEVASR